MTNTNLSVSKQKSDSSLNKNYLGENISEELLLQEIAKHDRHAFWQLWSRYQSYLFNCCYKWMNGNYHDTEEIFGQLMLKAWDKLPKYALKIKNVRSWLSRMAYNLCVDSYRHNQKQNMNSDTLDKLMNNQYCNSCEHLVSPENLLLRHEVLRHLRDRIDRLPKRLQEPLVLQYYYQMSCTEIAQRLMISQNSVYKRISHARKILQQQLNHYYQHDRSQQKETADSFCIAAKQKETADSYLIPSNKNNIACNSEPSNSTSSKSESISSESTSFGICLFANHNLVMKDDKFAISEKLIECQQRSGSETPRLNNRDLPYVNENPLEIINYEVTALWRH